MHFCNKKEGSAWWAVYTSHIYCIIQWGSVMLQYTLAHDSLQCFSCNNSLDWKWQRSKTSFSLLQELYNILIILLRKCSHFAGIFESVFCQTWIRHPSNCIPVEHDLYTQFTGPFPFCESGWVWLVRIGHTLQARASRFFISFGTVFRVSTLILSTWCYMTSPHLKSSPM